MIFFFFWSVKGDTGDHERRGRKGDSAGCLLGRWILGTLRTYENGGSGN